MYTQCTESLRRRRRNTRNHITHQLLVQRLLAPHLLQKKKQVTHRLVVQRLLGLLADALLAGAERLHNFWNVLIFVPLNFWKVFVFVLHNFWKVLLVVVQNLLKVFIRGIHLRLYTFIFIFVYIHICTYIYT